MGIFDKIKMKLFNTPSRVPEEAEIREEPVEAIKQDIRTPTGSSCFLCDTEIYSEESIRDFRGSPAHKRCVKKAKKLSLQGLSLEQLKQELVR